MEHGRVTLASSLSLAYDRWDPAESTAGGVAFVLVHGLSSCRRLWAGAAEALAVLGHPVVAVDLRGHGASDKPDDGYDVATVAGDLAEAIDRLGVARPAVAGQSWGGNVVLELAAMAGDRVAGIACVDGGTIDLQARYPRWDDALAAMAPPAVAGTPRDTLERWFRRRHPDWPEAGIEGTLACFEVRSDGTVAPWLTRDRHLQVLRGLWDHRPGERYPAIDVPVLLIPAVGGVAAQGDDLEVAQRALRKAQVHPMVGDHDLHAQHPAEVAALLHDAAIGFFVP